MITTPDRIGALISRIEAGDAVTQHDVDRIAALQALDVLKAGEDFARDISLAESRQTEELRKALEAP